MKTISSRFFPTVPFLAATLCLLMTLGQNARASAEEHIDDGLVVSKNWMAQIDAGQYDDSYASSSGELRDKVPQEHWSSVLKAIRTPWGPVVSRHQLSHVYKPNGFEGTEGEFLLITYETTFQNLPDATEFVVLRWEDGQWRGAGYNAGQKGSEAPAEGAPNSTTEVQTQQHVKPVAQ